MTRITNLTFELAGVVMATASSGEFDVSGHLLAETFEWTSDQRILDFLPDDKRSVDFIVRGVNDSGASIQLKMMFTNVTGDWTDGTASADFEPPEARSRAPLIDSKRAGKPPLEHTPNDLVPRFGDYPSSEHAYYRKAVLLPPHAADPLTDPRLIDAPLDLTAITDQQHGVDLPVVGVVLTHSQNWTRRRIALGNILHSLTLAPGEATRVAIQDWTHRTKGTGEEDTTQRDDSAASQVQARSLQEVQDSVAREAQHGTSSNQASSTSAQGGFALFGFSASAGHSQSVATAASSTDASRQIGADQNQQVHQSAEQHAQAARTRRATVVRESVESDEAKVTTRVVANYNHMHAMTIQYFEVVEVFEVETKVFKAEPCVFVPFALANGAWLLEHHPTIIADAAEAAGMDRVARTIRTLSNNIPLRSDSEGTAATVSEAKTAVAGAIESVTEIRSDAVALGNLGFQQIPQEGADRAGGFVEQILPWTEETTAEVRNLAGSVQRRVQKSLDTLSATNQSLDRLLQAEQAETEDEQHVQAQLVQRINEHLEYFNQAVWLITLTPRVVHLALKDRIFAGEILNDVIDPNPVAITGNLVGFSLASGQWLGGTEALPKVDVEHSVTSELAIPTGGVFAEAVLGQSVSAERIDLTRFWNWQESPIPLVPTAIKPVSTEHTTATPNLASGKLADSAAPLHAFAALPDATGMAALLETLGKGNLFRNMSGLDAAKELALETSKHATSGAEDAAKNAAENFKAWTEFAEKVVPMLLTDGASSILGGMANQAGGKAATSSEDNPAEDETTAGIDDND